MTDAARPAETTGGAPRVAVLDGLRAVAILAVMAFHYTMRWTPPQAREDLYPYHGVFNHLPILGPMLDYGWAGVELFFVVSGFVICMTLERSSGLWDFFRRRLARLWPAMLVCASITMLVAQFGPDQWKVGPFSFLTSILFIEPSLMGDWLNRSGLGWVDGVYWTLWVEVRFYLMAAILCVLFRRRFLAALTAVMVVSFLAGLRDIHYDYRSLAWLFLLPTFLPYFVFGVGAHRLQAGRRDAETLGALGLSAAAILAGGWLSFEYPAGGPTVFAAINLVIMAAFLLFALGSPLLRPFGWRPLAKLGEASYSLYLIHSVVGVVLIRLLSEIMPWPLALALVTSAMIALALVLFRWVEIPGKRLILAVTTVPTDFRPSSFLSRLRPMRALSSING